MISSLSRIINTNLLLLCLITSCFSFAQDNEEKIKEIKALSDKSYKSYLEYKSEESLEYAKQGNKIALEIGDSKSIAKTYNQIARAYTIMGKEKEALEYIEKALAEKFTLGEPLLHAKLIILKADNHARLGLDEIANKETFEALDLLKNETEPAALLEKASIYYFISKDFYDKKDYNSVIKYENLNGEILKTMDEKKVYPQMNSMYSLKGSAFLETKKFDSAYHYFTKAYELQKKYDESNLYQVYILLGNYYYKMDDDKKALEFYLKSVENYKSLQINDPLCYKFTKTFLKSMVR
ncbi:tetratricopeptide repeat protein [Chryseobacterium sp. Leaf394]|uniref:tetratricopeptide repeat protein n=1 Tax=Chryseobacterium sp. Leaf394 TaxID=1736361 RepID=UPI0006F81525|nr:tetratricopeptide repeat protein [Chryseobacterium sp. Leaf394]KQS89850.1 hypothetical protein ASG21_12775 [Chryseobacterium sp. Leaf394]